MFKGLADWGKTSTGWFYGIKIHLVINNLGEVIQTRFTTGSSSDTNIATLFYLLKDLSGWVFADKGYLMNEAKLAVVEYEGQIDFFAKPRKNKSGLAPYFLDSGSTNWHKLTFFE